MIPFRNDISDLKKESLSDEDEKEEGIIRSTFNRNEQISVT